MLGTGHRSYLRFPLRTVILSVLAAAASVLAMASPASATDAFEANATVLPFSFYQDMQVDAAHGHLFISGDDMVVVTDLAGNIVKTIDGEPGAAGMTLSADGTTLYVALYHANAIAAVDTTKLKEDERYKVGSLCPRDVAVDDGLIWFTHDCGDNINNGFSSLDVNDGRPTTHLWERFAGHHMLVRTAVQHFSSRQPQHLLLIGNLASQDDTVRVYDITGATPIRQSVHPTPPRVEDLAVSADGTQVVLAAGDSDHPYYTTVGLQQLGTYTTGTHPTAVALGARDRIAAGVEDTSTDATDLFVYEPGATTPTWTFDFGKRFSGTTGTNTIAPHGLAWGPDNNRLYAITVNFFGEFHDEFPVLHTLVPSTFSATSLSVSYLGPIFFGDPTGLEIHLGGQLTAATGVTPGAQTLHVTRTDSLGEVQLPDVVTAPDGSYDFFDTLRTSNTSTYTITFDGLDPLGPSQTSIPVNLSSP